jgi:DNA-binding IclR family transcriptional regulator
MQVRNTAQVYMQELADKAGDGVLVALGGRDDMAMTYIAAARSQGVISLQLSVGSRISLARSAIGQAYIAGTTESERADIIDRIQMRYEPDRVSEIMDKLDAAREQVAARGFYCMIGDWQRDVNAVAVPYRSQQPDTPMLAFNLGGYSFALPKERLEDDLGPRLVELVNMVNRVGY